MACSFYGVILLDDDNNVNWEFTFNDINEPVGKICGLDYNEKLNTILIGFKNRFIETNWNKEILFDYKFDHHVGIHSTYYMDNDWKILASKATQNEIWIINKFNNFEYIYLGNFVGDPHLNYAKQHKNKIYFTCLTHINNDKKGFLGYIDINNPNIIKEIHIEDYDFFKLDGPHCVEPLGKNKYLFTSTGNNVVGLIENNKLTWMYVPEDIKQPNNYIKSERPQIKYSKGAHIIEYLGDNIILIPLPNHRLVRIIDFNKTVLNEFKMPEYIHNNQDIGIGPRCVQAKLIK